MDIYSPKWNNVAQPNIMMQGASQQDFQQFTNVSAPQPMPEVPVAPVVINKKKVTTINNTVEIMDVSEISAQMKTHYQKYINHLKAKQAMDAASEFQKYSELRQMMQRAKGEI
ncbi:hypothetical protein MJH12_10125 [bacterium]|nr:hypothetical protein [bacterium]